MTVADLYPQYSEIYPEILAAWMTETEFRSLVSSVNAACERAFSPKGAKAWVDTILGVLTGWLWEDFGFDRGSRGIVDIENIIDQWNENIRRRRVEEGVLNSKDDLGDKPGKPREGLENFLGCASWTRTAGMSLDFVIPDPKVSVTNGSGPRQGGTSLRGSARSSRERARQHRDGSVTPTARSPIIPTTHNSSHAEVAQEL